ncbi:MAG: FtsB family cell division protein [Alphaproteobacteria bacterium]
MTLSHNFEKFLKGIATVLSIVLLGYAVFNGNGLVKLFKMQDLLSEKEVAYNTLNQERKTLDMEAKMLSGDSLDADFLEEQARIQFNAIGKDEVLINIE